MVFLPKWYDDFAFEDGFDEENCLTTCPEENQFQCIHENNKTLPLECIPLPKRCDGIEDCIKGMNSCSFSNSY